MSDSVNYVLAGASILAPVATLGAVYVQQRGETGRFDRRLKQEHMLQRADVRRSALDECHIGWRDAFDTYMYEVQLPGVAACVAEFEGDELAQASEHTEEGIDKFQRQMRDVESAAMRTGDPSLYRLVTTARGLTKSLGKRYEIDAPTLRRLQVQSAEYDDAIRTRIQQLFTEV